MKPFVSTDLSINRSSLNSYGSYGKNGPKFKRLHTSTSENKVPNIFVESKKIKKKSKKKKIEKCGGSQKPDRK